MAAKERGTPPVNFYEDFYLGANVENRRSRMAIGILPDKRFVVVGLHGTERRTYVPGIDSRDATASEIITVLTNLGCQDAIHLDGGGSGSLWFGGRLVNKPADRHDLPLRSEERFLHYALCIRSSQGEA
jgi:exopolysaccharide biosynthesis protein